MTGKSFLTWCLCARWLKLAGRNLLVGPGLADQNRRGQLCVSINASNNVYFECNAAMEILDFDVLRSVHFWRIQYDLPLSLYFNEHVIQGAR